MINEQELVTIYKATTRDEAITAVSLLESEGIAYTVIGDGLRDLEGFSIIGSANIGLHPILIKVLETDEPRAKEALRLLLEDYEPIDEETLTRMAEEACNPDTDY